MTERAPGLDAPRNDTGCFNCGSQYHFAYACPEPMRKEPHGAGFLRQRQAERSIPGGGGHGSDHSKPKNGLVVTRYGPPPPQYPPPANAWAPGGPYPPPVTAPSPNSYGHHPSAPYPPPGQQPPYPTPYPPATASYGAPHPPPPPPPPPAPTLPPAAPVPPYGQYGQPPYQPAPPPSPYGPPAPYATGAPFASSHYPPPYQPPPRPYSAAPPPGYPNPPPPGPPPNTYAPGYGSSMPPGPPPPPGTYPTPAHTSGYSPPTHYTPPFPPPHNPGWQQDARGHGSQRHKDRRDRRNDRDRGHKSRPNRRDNDSQQRGRGQRREVSAQPPSSVSRQESPKSSVVSKDDREEEPKQETPSTSKEAPTETKDVELDADFLWDMKKAFMEVKTKPADPVGKPLAAEWNEDPTIPPAYNARCITTSFYDPDNPDAFLASVRDTKYWTSINRDPVFRFRRGMVVVQFPGSHHEYFTYHCSRKTRAIWSKEREVVNGPSDPTLNDAAIKPSSTTHGFKPRKEADSPPKNTNCKRSYSEGDDQIRGPKRAKHGSGLDRSPSLKLPPRPPPPQAEAERESRVPHNLEKRVDSPHRPYSRDEYSRSPGYRLQSGDRFTPTNSTQRLDSGYHSTQSSGKARLYSEDRGRTHLSPPASIRARERDVSREHDRPRTWDRDADRQRERERPKPRSPRCSRPRSPSRSRTPPVRSRSPAARSRTPPAVESDDESVMSDLEYELLGLARPKKKTSPRKTPLKRQRPKVDNAFSRRW